VELTPMVRIIAKERAERNLLRLIGPERYAKLSERPSELRIPSRCPVFEWVISPRAATVYFTLRGKRLTLGDGPGSYLQSYHCVQTGWGFARVPNADKILALILWIRGDEDTFFSRTFPEIDMKVKDRLGQWDAIAEPAIRITDESAEQLQELGVKVLPKMGGQLGAAKEEGEPAPGLVQV